MIESLLSFLEIIPSILVFLLVFSVLIWVHEWGHFFSAKMSGIKVEEFGMGLGKKIWGKKRGETEFTINAIPFGGFVKMLGEEEHSTDPRSFDQAPLLNRMWVTLNGIFMNVLFTILSFSIIFSIGAPPILLSMQEVQVAAEKGIVVLSEEDGQQKILEIKDIKKPFLEAVPFSVSETWRISKTVLGKLKEIPGEIATQKKIPDSLSGPVGIAEATHKILPQGFIAILKLAALLSLSLAIMNLLPIPALDGGRFFFQIIELILLPFGIKIHQKIENIVHGIGYAFLLLLLFVITGNDILRIALS